MFNKSFNDIGIQDINALISNQVVERQNLEFKKEDWNRSRDGVREMLKDISSMANAYGGYIIVGMEEEPSTGKALKLNAVPVAGDERDRIFSSCLANLQPRIRGLDINTLEFSAGNEILLIKVPDSIDLHQIIHEGLYQFWIRHDRQKTRMSVDEIKDSILKSYQSGENVQGFLEKRKQLILLSRDSKLVLSATPVKLETELFKIDDLELREMIKETPERYNGWNFNFRNEQVKPSINGLKIRIEGFKAMEFYRNGYLEGVVNMSSGLAESKKYTNDNGQEIEVEVIRAMAIVEYVYTFLKKLKFIINKLGYDGQYIINLSLINIEGMGLQRYRHDAIYSDEFEIYTEPHIEIEPLIYESIDPILIAKELLDRVWQAYGFEHEPYNGNFDFSKL